MGRAARALTTMTVLAAAFAATATTSAASAASAATAISPPTITAPLGGLGPYAVGSSVTFTFTETGVGTPVAYKYSLNGGKLVKVAAPSGTASVQIVVPERQTQSLTAYAVAADGTVSGGTLDNFLATLSPAAADKDLTGDGVPDLLTVGDTTGLAPGLWLATGRTAPGAAAKGRVKTPRPISERTATARAVPAAPLTVGRQGEGRQVTAAVLTGRLAAGRAPDPAPSGRSSGG
jgi:hypothetical protein